MGMSTEELDGGNGDAAKITRDLFVVAAILSVRLNSLWKGVGGCSYSGARAVVKAPETRPKPQLMPEATYPACKLGPGISGTRRAPRHTPKSMSKYNSSALHVRNLQIGT